MKIRYWDHIPGKGDGVVERDIDFDPNAHTSAESAARAFHAALVKLIEEATPDDDWFGQNPDTELAIWEPGERMDMTDEPNVWAVCWEAGPYRWGGCTHSMMTEAFRSYIGPWSFMIVFKERQYKTAA